MLTSLHPCVYNKCSLGFEKVYKDKFSHVTAKRKVFINSSPLHPLEIWSNQHRIVAVTTLSNAHYVEEKISQV